MRACILTDEISQDLDKALDLCRRRGFPAIEVRSVWNTPPHQLTLNQCHDIAERARDQGIGIAGFASPVFKTPLPDSDAGLVQCEALLARALDQCEALGTRLLRVFSFYRDAVPDVPRAAAAMDAVLARVPTDGVTLAVETGTRTNTPTAALARELLGLLGRPTLRILWDPGNTVFSGIGDTAGLVGLTHLRPCDLAHVHVKDPLGANGYVELGRGALPWPHILDALAERGYCGYLSLETHWRRGRVLTASERDEPWGDGFSSGGYEASDACMATLAQWIASRTGGER
jgi:sugar phosphate isomerase/epimerase